MREYTKSGNNWKGSYQVFARRGTYLILPPKDQEKLGYKATEEDVQALLPSPTPTTSAAPEVLTNNDGSSGQPVKPGPLDHWRGKTDARYVWIVFTGLETEYGKTNHSNLKRLFDRYGEQMAWVFRHYPQETILPKERWLASVAECAAMKDNDTFWKMVDTIFQKMPNLTEADTPSLITEVGLENNFYDTTCKANPQINNKIRKDIRDGRMVGINGTPENVLYDTRTARVQRLPGAQPYEVLERALVDFMRQ
jgi:hypothetical protein